MLAAAIFFFAVLQAQLLQTKRWEAYEGYDMDPTDDSKTLDPADWHWACDPWKTGDHVNDTHYDDLTIHPSRDPSDTYVCPEEMRSPSGCGDFRDDPRGMECPEGGMYDQMTGELEVLEDTAVCSDQRIAANDPDKMWQFHACVQHPIYYTYKSNDFDQVWPPSTGRHRERWPKWGEYEFLPEQRWLHGSEHGAMVFLYNPCLITMGDLCKLRQFIHGLPKYFVNDHRFRKFATDRDDIADLRFLLTPYKNLRKEFAISAFNAVYFSKCWNVPGMLSFINEHYREAWEDYPPSGAYDYLWQDYTAQAECQVDDQMAEKVYKPYGGFPEVDLDVGPPGYRWSMCVEKTMRPVQKHNYSVKGTPTDCFEACQNGIPRKAKLKLCKFWLWDASKGKCLLYQTSAAELIKSDVHFGGKRPCHPWKGQVEKVME